MSRLKLWSLIVSPIAVSLLVLAQSTSQPSNYILRIPRTIAQPVNHYQLNWNPYTNVWFRIDGTTDFIAWTFVTNVPVWMTNLPIVTDKYYQFFRISTEHN